MQKKKVSERKVILYTAGLVVLTGVVRLIAYSVGTVLFYLAFAPFLIYRLVSAVKNRKKQKDTIYYYRFLVLSVMIITIVLNIAGWQDADFFLIFLLMVDYLLVINRKF
ncbi:MAG: hypothetical protein R6U65_06610 [Perlabentimonas sp.]